jgi:hypothetical protein
VANATAAIDTPGSLQAVRTFALSSALCCRRGTELECIGVHQSNSRTPSSAPAHGQTRWDGWTLAEYLGDRCEAFLPRVRTVHAYVRDAIALADELEWAYHVVPTR